ncbi:MAG: hypothetical protein IJW23_14330 [Lentisphaeria bacterium]|nr:hypothetical protein [Lentisphaeria bacterium]
MAQIEYSCKRKKDFVTFIAVALFVIIFIFEIYLIVFIRIQLQRENALAHDVLKQKMLRRVEDVRHRLKNVKPKTPLQNCEAEMVGSALESVVQFVRQNRDVMTSQQIVQSDDLLVQLMTYTHVWRKKQFMFKQEKLEFAPVLRSMEEKLDKAAAEGR